ncbi:MAG: OmpA family protein [Nitrospirales bacterium]|nr:OmpA family protein [Nitrospirales bacterium]
MIQAIRIGLGLFTLVLIGTSPAFPATPAHRAVQYGEQALAFSSGFIREDVPADGVVAKTAYNRQVVGHGDTVYLRMKHADDVALGSLYTVYRRSRKVFHPANGHYLGNLFSIVGVVRVTKIDNDFATAKVDHGYMWIAPGDMVMPFTLPSGEERAITETSLTDSPGMVIEIQTPRTLVAQSNIVYLDLGRADGLRLGDRLEVLRSRRGFPTESIGEVKILALEEMTATALILQTIMPVTIGDQVMPKELNRDAVHSAHSVKIRQTPVSASTKARESLTKSLQAEIAKGDVSVEQVGDKVTISLNDLVNQLEYESGEAQIKPTGIKILKQISEYLKQDTDNEILVEGHTDNQPIGPTLVKHYPTNQELSEARASMIVRYFVDAGIDPGALTAIGYAHTRPVSNNAREEGRKRNRRIEIVLTPRQDDPPQEELKSTELPGEELKPVESKPVALPSAEPEALESLHVNVPPSPDTALQDMGASPSPEPMRSN